MPVSAFRGKIIDAHNHPDWHGYNFERFVANMDEFGIAKTWLLSWVSPADEYDPYFHDIIPGGVLGSTDGPIPFSCCLTYQQRAADRFVLGYAPDPRRPGAVDKMRAAIDIYGVRACGELKLRMMYDNPDAIALFQFCATRQVPVTVHIDYPIPSSGNFPRSNYWYGGGIAAFERALQQCPDTVFLGHAPGFWAHISAGEQFDSDYYPSGPVQSGGLLPAMLRKYPNLYGDISANSGRNALSRDAKFGREFVLEFQDRLLYARDYFDNQHQELLEQMELPDEVLEKILITNAEKLIMEG